MIDERKLKILLSKYLNRKYDVVVKYFAGASAGPVVAEKMERLTGIHQKYFRRPDDFGMRPFSYCTMHIEKVTEKLEKMGYKL